MNERLKLLRKTLGITQQQLADKIDIKRNTLATYESGRNEPIDAVISLICKTNWNGQYVNKEWLVNGNGEMFIEMSRDEEIAGWVGRILSDESAEFKRRVIGALSRMNESGWDELEKFLNDLQNNKS